MGFSALLGGSWATLMGGALPLFLGHLALWGLVIALVATGNRAPSNGGMILDTDLLTPILVAVLLWLSRAERTRLKG
ncbi:hypothetical protein KBY76_00195 [Synechococcus sp. GreenBA-s]|nr:hypothetical protein [Synechococcus sp. GreenBA-s]